MPALDGIRVLDLSQYEAGPSCTQALALLGAEVVKIERPKTGEPGRSVGGFKDDSPYFLYWNSNKRSVVIDLAAPEGRDLLLRMLPKYDILVENYGPGVVDKLRLDYKTLSELHPPLVYASVKGFGASGPYSSYKSFDMVAQAASGAFSVTGEPDGTPMRPGPTLGDTGTGMQLGMAILAAYVQRMRTGKGQEIELSMQEAMTYYMRTMIALGTAFGEEATPRTGTGLSPDINMYACKPFGANDYFYFVIATARMWEGLCKATGLEALTSDERFSGPLARMKNAAAFRELIEDWAGQYTKYEVMQLLAEAGVPCSAVLDTHDLMTDPHLRSRGFVESISHPAWGDVELLGFPSRLSESKVPMRAAPQLGEGTGELLAKDLGISDTEIAALREAGTIGGNPS
jgi:formyl-CoA transferase